jgi:hypothetical protein
MEVSGQLHTPAALPPGKNLQYPLNSAGRVSLRAEEKNLTPTGNRTPAVQAVARRYTDSAIPDLNMLANIKIV